MILGFYQDLITFFWKFPPIEHNLKIYFHQVSYKIVHILLVVGNGTSQVTPSVCTNTVRSEPSGPSDCGRAGLGFGDGGQSTWKEGMTRVSRGPTGRRTVAQELSQKWDRELKYEMVL